MITRNIFVKNLNDELRAGRCEEAQKLLNWYCAEYLPYHVQEENYPCPKNEWWLDVLHRPIPPNTICLMAHSGTAKRVLAVLNPAPTNNKSVPTVFCYSYKRLHIKKRTEVINKTTKSKRTVMRLELAGEIPKALITPRRGFWVIWAPSLLRQITFDHRYEHETELMDWYSKYIHGMEKPPTDELPRIKQDFEFEQFKLARYPTIPWRNHTLGLKKLKTKQIIFVDNGAPPPPPPPTAPIVMEPPTKKRERIRRRGRHALMSDDDLPLLEAEMLPFSFDANLAFEPPSNKSKQDLSYIVSGDPTFEETSEEEEESIMI